MNNATRILIVEDNPADYDLAQREIRKSVHPCAFERVETREEYLAGLKSFQPDVILSDYGLPSFSSLRALELAQEHASLTPFIIWTGSVSEEVAAECMKAGANNYVLKANPMRLGPAVRHALEERRLLIERKEAEDKLRRSESNYRALAENSLQGIAIFQRHSIVYVNPAMCAIMGYTAEELLAMSEDQILALTHPDDRAVARERAAKRLAGEPVSSFNDVRIIRKDGTIRWIQTFASAIEYDGQPAILSTSIDITERKQAEGKYQAIYENSPVGIFQSTPQGRFINVNPAMAHIYGYNSPEEMMNSVNDIAGQIYLKPEERRVFTHLIETQGTVQGFEWKNFRKDGSVFWTSTSARVVRDKDGNVLYYEGFLQDITARKEADERLVESEKRFRALIANGMDNISLLAEDGTLLWEDPSTNIILGYERGRFIGENILQLLHPADVEPINQLFTKLVHERGSIQEATFRLKHRNGTWRWVQTTATNMLEEPSVKAIVLNYRDVTERKHAEIENQKKNDDLALLNAVNQAVVQGQSLDSIVEMLSDELKRIFSAVGSTVYILSADKRFITMQQYSFSPETKSRIEKLIGFKIPKIQIPIKEGGHFHNTLITKQSTITSDPQKIEEWIGEFAETTFLPSIARAAVRKLIPHIYKLLNIKSTIIVPLISQEEVIGFLDVSSSDLFTRDDLKRTEKIGEQLTSLLQRQQANEKLRRSEEFLQSVQNALSAHIAILDEEGYIVQVNSAWRKFAEENGLEHANFGIGLNYLEICDTATGPDSAEAQWVAKAIREVIAGHKREAWVEYACHSPQENRWFVLRITKFDDGDHIWVVLAHENITERKQMEAKLQTSENRYRLATLATKDVIWEWDPKDGQLIWTENAQAAFGYSPDEVGPEETWWDEHLHPEDRQRVLSSINAAMAGTDSVWSEEYRFLLKDGSYAYVNDHAYIERDTNSRVTRLIGAMSNITKRRQAEQELKHSHSLLYTTLESTADGILVVTPDGKISTFNQKFLELWRIPDHLAMQKDDQTLLDFVIDQLKDPSTFIAKVESLYSSPEAVSYDELEFRDGRVFERYSQPQRLGDTILGRVWSFRDITERKRAEGALRQAEKQLDLFFSQSLDGFFFMMLDKPVRWDDTVNKEEILDYVFEHQRITKINKAMLDQYRTTSEQFLGKTTADFFAHDPEQGRRTLRQFFDEGHLHIGTDERRFDGTQMWIEGDYICIYNDDGNITGHFGVQRDITERKQTEAAEREQRALAEALRDTAETLNSTLEFGEVLDHILAAVGRVVPHDAGTIMLIDGEFAKVVRSHGYEKRGTNDDIVGIKLPLAKTNNLRQILETGQPLIVYDTYSYMGWKRLKITDWLRSNVGAPISIHGEVIGFILLDSEIPEFFTAVHAERLKAFANQAALAIQNARLLQQAQEEILERTQAEEALREGEEKYRLLFENNPLPMWIFDLETLRFLKVNGAAIDLYGYTENEFMAMTIKDIRPSVDVPKLIDNISRANDGVDRAGIWNHIKKDGSMIEVEIVSHAVEFDGRRAKLVLANDITERKRAEDELRASEERFRQLADNIQEVFWMTDAISGEEIYISPASEKIWGHSMDDFLHNPDVFIETILPEDRPLVLEKIEEQRSGSKTDMEYRIAMPDGSVRWVWDRGFPVFDDNSNVKAVAGITADITERKLAEGKLRASEERYNRIANTIPGILYDHIRDSDGSERISYMSPRCREIFEVEATEVMNDINALHNLIHPEDIAEFMSANKSANLIFDAETRIITPSGQIKWVHFAAQLSSVDQDETETWSGVILDSTGRKQAELALLQSQARYHDLFDNSPISLWEEDYSLVKKRIESLQRNGVTDLREYLLAHPEVTLELASLVKIVDVNRVSLQLYHVRRKEDLLKSLTEFVSHETLQQFRNEIIGLISTSRFEWEGKDQTADGSELMVMVNGSIPPGYEKDWSKVIISISDITERKRTEEALRESEERFSSAYEFAPIGIALVSPDGRWVKVNQALCELTGYTESELMSKTFQDITHPEDLEADLRYVEQMLRSEINSYEMEKRYFHKSGTIVWVLLSVSLVKDGEGMPRYFIAQIQDITERKQTERESTRQLAELEALYENGLAVGRLLEPKEIGNQVIQTFARYLSWHHVAIRLLNPETDKLDLIAFNQPGLSDEDRAAIEDRYNTMVSTVGQGLSGSAMQTGSSIRTGNVHTHPQYVDTQEGITSGLYMPLKVGTRVIGSISVESNQPDAFSAQDERLLATLANQAAIAFENAHLYLAAQQEISERKRAQDALWTSETHYRQLADSITDMLFELDRDLRYTHWNKASEMFFGVPAEDAIGRSIEELFGRTEEQLKREEIYRNVLQERQARTFETLVTANGQKRFLEISAYPSARGVSLVAKDITERRLAETLMQKRFELMEYSAHHSLEEVMLRTIDEVSDLTESHVGFLHFIEEDQKTIRLQAWSTETLRLKGETHPQQSGMHYPVETAGVWADAVRQRHSVIHNDYESLPNKKGLPEEHVKITREMVIPIIRNEKIAAVLGVGNKEKEYTHHDLEIVERFADYAWDITERKQMESALADERNQLARRVEERTADLSRANSNLARALHVKDEFLANMSHELRTPLNAILGLSESLSEQVAGPLNEKQQKYLSTINESGHHLLALINDILDLAKIEAGQITLDINKVDVNSVCQASLRMIKQLAQRKNQEVRFDIDQGIGLMWADERRLKQMIVNLLSNAVKFTPESGALGLEVRGDISGNKVMISVWDQGIGIHESDLQRLFKPFVQLDAGLAREASGTGLGLALVAQMARLHGGSVTVESELSKGSRFTLLLPWEPAIAGESDSRLKSSGKFRAIKPNEVRPTILLIEDTREVVMMLMDYLEMAGFNMVTAQDGIDGLIQAKIAHPDLILMDIQMPRMDGFETTIKLRSDPEFKETPIIALTALAMPNDRARCLAAGMNEYLSKPVNLKALVKSIRTFLYDAEADQA